MSVVSGVPFFCLTSLINYSYTFRRLKSMQNLQYEIKRKDRPDHRRS